MEDKQRKMLVVAGAVAFAVVAFLLVWAFSGDGGDDAASPSSTTTSVALTTSSSTVPVTADTTATSAPPATTAGSSTSAPAPTSSSTTTTPGDGGESTSTTTAPDDATAGENARLVTECLAGDVDACFEVGARQLPPPGDFGTTKYADAADDVVEQACFDNKVPAACYVAGRRGLPVQR